MATWDRHRPGSGTTPNGCWPETAGALSISFRNPGRTARIAGSTHISFMDVPFLPVRPDSPVAGMLAATTIRPEQWRLTSDLLLAFLGEHLDGFSNTADGFPGTDQPEVSLRPS